MNYNNALIPLFLGVIIPISMAIVTALLRTESRPKIKIAWIVHSVLSLIYCLAVLGPNGSRLLPTNDLSLSSAILSEKFALTFAFGVDKIWWFLALSCLCLLNSIGVLRFGDPEQDEDYKYYVLQWISFTVASLCLFAKGVFLSCVFFELWLLVQVYLALILRSNQGKEVVQGSFVSRIFVLSLMFLLIFLLKLDNLLTDSTVGLYAILGYLATSVSFRPIVKSWAHLMSGCFGLLLAGAILIQTLSFEVITELNGNISVCILLFLAVVFAILSFRSRSLVNAVSLYASGAWFLVCGSFISFPADLAAAQILILAATALSISMILFVLAMKDFFIKYQIKWLFYGLSVLLSLVAIGMPLSTGFLSVLTVAGVSLYLQIFYYFGISMIALANAKILVSYVNDPEYNDVDFPLTYREATPWFMLVVLALSNEYFVLGSVLGVQTSSGWLGILGTAFAGPPEKFAFVQAGIFFACAILGVLLGVLLSKRSPGDDWSRFQYRGGSYTVMPDIEFFWLKRFGFLNAGPPIYAINRVRIWIARGLEGSAYFLNFFENRVLERFIWKESTAYLRSFSMFFRFLHNGQFRDYFFFAFVVVLIFISAYWSSI